MNAVSFPQRIGWWGEQLGQLETNYKTLREVDDLIAELKEVHPPSLWQFLEQQPLDEVRQACASWALPAHRYPCFPLAPPFR